MIAIFSDLDYGVIGGHERSYQALKSRMRREHDVVEWGAETIMYNALGSEEKEKPTRCIVKGVDKYFITLELPKGYCRSFAWDEFERIRVKKTA